MPKKKRRVKDNNTFSNIRSHIKTAHKQVKHNFNKHITHNFNKHITHHIRHHSRKIHKHLIHHFHRRKYVEYDELPEWKKFMFEIHHRHFHWLEAFVEYAIPWIVLVLFFIIVAEFGGSINHVVAKIFGHEWLFLEKVAAFGEEHHKLIILIDQIIIGFFVVDLYFNFFKKATLASFFRTYFIDIIAILPLGVIAALAAKEIEAAQSVTHVAVDTERITARSLRATKIARIIKAIGQLPRLIRVYRIYQHFIPSEKSYRNSKHKKK